MSKPPQPTVPLDPAIFEFLDKTGLAKNGEFEAEPLTGGVASDIWKISDKQQRVRREEGAVPPSRRSGVERPGVT